MDSFSSSLPEVVYQARTRANITQGELADRAGVSRHTVVNIESGAAAGVRLDKLSAVLGALGMELMAVPRRGVEPMAQTEDAESLRREFRARFVRGGGHAVRTTRGQG